MNQHINTFEGGMSKDYAIELQPNGTYRHMVNCHLVSEDGNNFAVKDCLGNVQTFTLPQRYTNNTLTLEAPYATPLAFISFPDKLVVLYTGDETSSGDWGAIGIIRSVPYGEGIQPLSVAGQMCPGLTVLYHHNSLNFTKLKRIDGFGYSENETVERIYWTDNLNEPRVLNIADSSFTTYIASGSLSGTAGVKYMVVEGLIEYPVGGGVWYGPSSNALIDTVLTTDGVHTTYTATSGTAPTPKVIEYFPYELLSFTPDKVSGSIQFDSFGTGTVKCGSKVYFYRLTADSIATPWSYPSAPIHVPSTQDFTIAVAYHDTVGGGTTTAELNSLKSVKVNIDNIDTRYSGIELAVMEYNNAFDTPTSTSIVAKYVITGTSMTLEHNGASRYDALTLSDLTLVPASILTAKTLSTNKGYILAGNIVERPELDDDLLGISGITYTSFNYPMPVYGDPLACSSLMDFAPVVPVTGANPAATTIVPDSRYVVTDDTGGSVEYPVASGTFYAQDQVFVGVSGSATATIPAGTEVRPCVTRNRYDNQTTGDRTENYIEIPASAPFWDYKSAVVDQHCKGYWSAETYRYGILYYDKKGNPYYVRHICDYTFPTISHASKAGLMIVQSFGGNDCYSLNPSGIKFSNIVIPSSIIDDISGFSIVRAVRDPRILAQGLVGQMSLDNTLVPPEYRPTAWPCPNGDLYAPPPGIFTFLSPDHLVNFPFKDSFGEKGDTIEMAGWLNAIAYTASYAKTNNDGQSFQSTFIVPLTGDTDLQASEVTRWLTYNEGEIETNFDGSGNTFKNTMYTNTVASAFAVTDDACIGGVSTNLGNRNAQGSRKAIFTIGADFHHYSSANAYTAAAELGNPKKMLMNYCKSKPVQYGSLEDTTYISTGHYQPITAQVKTDTFDGSSNYIFDNVEVFGGDCYVSLVDQAYALWDDGLAKSCFSAAWYFPCESTTNYGLRRGRKSSGAQIYQAAAPPTAQSIAYFITGTGSRLEGYSYNPGYSTEGQSVKYPAAPAALSLASQFKTRVRFAGEKIAGEQFDSFRKFLVNDYRDMEGISGEINNIKTKNNRTLVWQNSAISTIPVLERQVIGGQQAADAVAIGTGGVVDRFDQISSFGNQHQWGLTETEFGYAWFDMRNKAFLVYENGGGITEISQILGLKSYFSEIFIEVLGTFVSADKLLNSPTFAATSDQPLMGIGITGVFDPKLKMTYLTFKFMTQASVGGNPNYINKDFTIGYYHPIKRFIGFYEWLPSIAHNHNGFVYACNNPKNRTKYYGTGMASTNFVVGEVTAYGPYEMMCIQDADGVVNSIAAKDPSFASGAATAYWTPINKVNEIWVNNQPAALGQTIAPDYIRNKFFGAVVNNEIQFVVNPRTQNPFAVLNIEQLGNNVYPTDVYTDAGSQTASDLSIKSWDKNFRYIIDRLCHSLPLSSTGRIVNRYLKIRIVKKNWTTDPTTVTGVTKVLNSVRSFFIEKR